VASAALARLMGATADSTVDALAIDASMEPVKATELVVGYTALRHGPPSAEARGRFLAAARG